jgi:hypothetical protein
VGRDDARELAVALVAAYEGIALLANAERDDLGAVSRVKARDTAV